MKLLVASKRKPGRPASKKRDCLAESLAGGIKSRFKRELAVYFINRGSYRLTEKGIANLGNASMRQYVEPVVHSEGREISETIVFNSKPAKTEMRSSAKQNAWKMIGEGKAGEIYDLGYAVPRISWLDSTARISAIRKLAEALEKKPCRLNADDFTKNCLAALLCKYYNGSPFRALREEGAVRSIEETIAHSQAGKFENTERIYPWEMAQVASRLFENRDLRIAACRWLIWKTGKDPKLLKFNDFCNNSLAGLIKRHYNSSPFGALVETGRAYSLEETQEHIRSGQFNSERIYPWEANTVSKGFFNSLEMRVGACNWLIWKTGKKPAEITVLDYDGGGLGGLLCKHYGNSPFAALVESGYAYSLKETHAHAKEGNFQNNRIYPWGMPQVPAGFLQEKEFRISSTKWLVWKTRKEPRDLKAEDFNSRGLYGLLSLHYGNSPFRALIEAGYGYSEQEVLEQYRAGFFKNEKIYPWEMKQVMHGFFDNPKLRSAAVRWLILKTGKSAEKLQANDFRNNRLGGLLMNRYGNSPIEAIREALGN